MPRVFVAGVHAPGDEVTLAADDTRKLLIVLRKAPGDAIEIVDSSGRTFAAELRSGSDAARAALKHEIAGVATARVRMTLAQGVPKGQKMDFVVEKATELGVARIVPFASERTVGGPAERAGKVDRWRRLAKSAAAQCGRPDVPEVDDVTTYENVTTMFSAHDAALVPWELAPALALRDTLPALVASASTAIVVIGPEGGLAQSEADAARARGAHLISLGRRIFRTETAGLVACAAILFATGDL